MEASNTSNSIRRNKVIAFSVADSNNTKYSDIMVKMFKHFNPDIEMRVYGDEEIRRTEDPQIFYRATPYFTQKLMNEGYDTVIKIDADSFVFSNLDFMVDGFFDVGTVLNYNRTDPKTYGTVSVWDIPPFGYVNCGLVVMKNKKFVDHWKTLCYRNNFQTYKYREQDLLNIMVHYGDYNVKAYDFSKTWNGLISKGENARFILKDGKVILPKAEDNYPEEDKQITVYHTAGGNVDNKMNYRILFQQSIIDMIDNILHN
jgi:hypothetical protein